MALSRIDYRNSAGRLLAVLNASPAGQSYHDFLSRLLDSTERTTEESRAVCYTNLVAIHNLHLELLQDMNNPTIRDKTTGSGIFSIALFEDLPENPPSRGRTKRLNPSTALPLHASHALPLTPHPH
jgi:hypothetical protein